jgi:hypothetical protein
VERVPQSAMRRPPTLHDNKIQTGDTYEDKELTGVITLYNLHAGDRECNRRG